MVIATLINRLKISPPITVPIPIVVGEENIVISDVKSTGNDKTPPITSAPVISSENLFLLHKTHILGTEYSSQTYAIHQNNAINPMNDIAQPLTY
jgi:hypothetical protein